MRILVVARKSNGIMGRVYSSHGIAPTIYAHGTGGNHIYVLVTPKSINMPSKSMNDISQDTETMETSPKLTPAYCTTSTSFVEDFHASLSQLLENEVALQTLAEHSSLTLREYCKLNNLPDSYWKTLKDCFLTTTDSLSKPSSPRLMNWGTTSNGKCLTARITESPRTGSECSLSDILEEHPDQKYFLSAEATIRLVKNMQEASELRDSLNKCTSQGHTNNQHESTDNQVISPTLSSGEMQGRYNIIADRQGVQPEGNIANAKCEPGWEAHAIRRLTPTECERLQGFPDGWTEGVSDTQRYKCLGNAVTVNVVREIMKRIL